MLKYFCFILSGLVLSIFFHPAMASEFHSFSGETTLFQMTHYMAEHENCQSWYFDFKKVALFNYDLESQQAYEKDHDDGVPGTIVAQFPKNKPILEKSPYENTPGSAPLVKLEDLKSKTRFIGDGGPSTLEMNGATPYALRWDIDLIGNSKAETLIFRVAIHGDRANPTAQDIKKGYGGRLSEMGCTDSGSDE
jgi:hypothetical protein